MGLKKSSVWLPFYHCVSHIFESHKVIIFLQVGLKGCFLLTLVPLHKVIVVIKYRFVGF